ncbi:Multifunctional non-homologous end joining DNA repair protein LigD [Methylacidimicrobium cyclopophantes]|uniref:Multifunctional non-homologous end joining DNA repair protein LigD n=1 Tax=Methylacidimicrobium cyclopophantes TaxID=1041766 RepID=A0A5E6MDT7_9BACT|nr:Multifunctional non-homologous end joining DNA repair protein LigD [Methylacidimicrobium cyclopophantes]
MKYSCPAEGIFVIQEHFARTHHFDFRLERNGVLKSWALPKGVPEEEGVRRLAVEVEDHPLSYAGFSGTIPHGQYGAGQVRVWDRGNYRAEEWEPDKITFELLGKRISGKFALIRLKRGDGRNWILLRRKE